MELIIFVLHSVIYYRARKQANAYITRVLNRQ